MSKDPSRLLAQALEATSVNANEVARQLANVLEPATRKLGVSVGQAAASAITMQPEPVPEYVDLPLLAVCSDKRVRETEYGDRVRVPVRELSIRLPREGIRSARVVYAEADGLFDLTIAERKRAAKLATEHLAALPSCRSLILLPPQLRWVKRDVERFVSWLHGR